MNDFLKYINLGIMMVAPAALGLFLGHWIDGWAGTTPGFTLGLLILGILSGLWTLFKDTRDLM
jgi:F0F1-type ATP synthase assembly protein I